jgi:hypothetical protein
LAIFPNVFASKGATTKISAHFRSYKTNILQFFSFVSKKKGGVYLNMQNWIGDFFPRLVKKNKNKILPQVCFSAS